MRHIPVMLEESLSIFAGQTLRIFFDGTLGAGGFAKALLNSHPEIEHYIGCDRDSKALELARETLAGFESKVSFVHSNFSALDLLLEERGITRVDGFFLIWECRRCN